jgi:hypothetical protein
MASDLNKSCIECGKELVNLYDYLAELPINKLDNILDALHCRCKECRIRRMRQHEKGRDGKVCKYCETYHDGFCNKQVRKAIKNKRDKGNNKRSSKNIKNYVD